jgi:hypothetical protein
MEPLIEWSPRVRRVYRRLLTVEQLDPQRFGQDPSFFDEVPLYSRDAHLDGLGDLSGEGRELAVVLMAAWLWVEAEANLLALEYAEPYALFLSVWEWDEGELPVPYVFFCGSEVSRVAEGIALSPPTSETAERLRQHLVTLGLEGAARIFEDLETVPGSTRVLVDFALPCNPRKVRLDDLRADPASGVT